MTARLVALLAAVAMVVGAIVARDAIDDDGSGGRSGAALKLVCDTALASVCEAVAAAEGDRVKITVEGAFSTFDRLVGQDASSPPYLDGWLVTAPWPGMLAAARQREGQHRTLFAGEVLARSPVVMVVRTERRAPLTARCNGTIGWKCVGEVAGASWATIPQGDANWGSVRPAHPPTSTAVGLTVLGAGAVSFFDGRTDLSSDDLEEGPFQDWLSRLERAGPRPADAAPFQTQLNRPSAYDLVGTVEADAGPGLATAASRDKPVLLYPSPVVTADVVLAVDEGRTGQRMARVFQGGGGLAALAAAGWRVPGQRPVAGVPATPALPPASNLPDPDVLQALLTAASEVTR